MTVRHFSWVPMKSVFRFLLHCVLEGYFRLLERTVRLRVAGREPLEAELASGRSAVVASPHNVLLPCLFASRGLRTAFLVSRSSDGEMIARILERRGFCTVRGSSSRGGTEALASLRSLVIQGGVAAAIAFDGPKGPPLVPKPGVAALALAGEAKVFFVWARTLPNRFLRRPLAVRLGSWDRFLLIFPFCRVEVTFEECPEGCITTRDGGQRALRWIEERARALFAGLHG